MNIDREHTFPYGGSPLGVPTDNFHPSQPGRIQLRELRAEEVKVWKDCSKEALFVSALPFAIGMHLYNSYSARRVAQNQPPANGSNPPSLFQRVPLLKSASLFVLNVVVGHFFYTPVCYRRLRDAVIENEKKLAAQQQGVVIPVQESFSKPDDFNFQSSLDPNLDGPEANFSHLAVDFDSSISDKLVLGDDVDDKAKKPSIAQTTYDDLRKINREKYSRDAPPSDHLDVSRYSSYPSKDPSKVPENPVSPNSPPKRVTKNKYGDEME